MSRPFSLTGVKKKKKVNKMSAKLLKADEGITQFPRPLHLSLRQMFAESLETKQFLFHWMDFIHLGENHNRSPPSSPNEPVLFVVQQYVLNEECSPVCWTIDGAIRCIQLASGFDSLGLRRIVASTYRPFLYHFCMPDLAF